jgi:hypothetical protein
MIHKLFLKNDKDFADAHRGGGKGKLLWSLRAAAFVVGFVMALFAADQICGTLFAVSETAEAMLLDTLGMLILIVSVLVCGPTTGMAVAVFAPVLAKLFGFAPVWADVPLIVGCNLGLIILWYCLGSAGGVRLLPKLGGLIASIAVFASLRCVIFYLETMKLAVWIAKSQAMVWMAAFSLSQVLLQLLLTALATLVIFILPFLKKIFWHPPVRL